MSDISTEDAYTIEALNGASLPLGEAALGISAAIAHLKNYKDDECALALARKLLAIGFELLNVGQATSELIVDLGGILPDRTEQIARLDAIEESARK